MAKKKKTKIGNALAKIGSAIKGAVQQGTTKLKQAVDKSQVNKGGLLANVSGALGKSTQVSVPSAKAPAGTSSGVATISAPKRANIFANIPRTNKGTGSSSNYPGLVGNIPSGISFGSQGVDLGKAFSYGGLTQSVPTLGKATAPTTAEDILSSSSVGSLSLSGGGGGSVSSTSMGIGSTAGAKSAVAGVDEANNLAMEEKKSAEQQLMDNVDKEKKGLLEQLFKKQDQEPTREELRQDYEQEFNIKARTAEINSLQQDLDKVMNEVSNQEAIAKDRLGTNDFINNQIAQIRRNSEPIINQLSSEIKWKSGLLSEDRALMNEAISDALADSRSRIDNMKWFYGEYSENLDNKYKEALTAKIKNEDRTYEEKQAFLEYARDVAWEYAQKGVRMNINPYTITPEELASKIQSNPLPQRSSSKGSYEFSNDIDSYAQEYLDNVDFDIDSVPQEIRGRVISRATEIATQALNSQPSESVSTTNKVNTNGLFKAPNIGSAAKEALNYTPSPVGFFSRLFGK